VANHSFEEHIGEVRLWLRADALPELFAEAGRALAELMTDSPSAPRADAPSEDVVVRARDREALLVEWLNELIYRSEMSKKIYTELDVERLDERELHAKIRGIDATDLRTAVKAATLHDVRIEEREGSLSASVVLDV
jgi:SHS2 domain-containing protein